MSVDRHEVRRIADLAKLSLADDEVDRLADEMTRVLAHARRLREVKDVDEEGDGDVAPSPAGAGREGGIPSGPDPLVHATRSMAPEMQEGFFLVPPPPGVVRPTEGDAPEDA